MQPTAIPAIADLDSELDDDDDVLDVLDVLDVEDVAVEAAEVVVVSDDTTPLAEVPVNVALKQETLVVKSLSSTRVWT